jgi:hypothetical protein
MELDGEQRAMLEQALNKARHLVYELEKQKAEVDAAPPSIPAEKLEEGRHAMIKAVASARRTLAALEDAERMANTPQDDKDDD